jgi:hypothetical protein
MPTLGAIKFHSLTLLSFEIPLPAGSLCSETYTFRDNIRDNIWLSVRAAFGRPIMTMEGRHVAGLRRWQKSQFGVFLKNRSELQSYPDDPALIWSHRFITVLQRSNPFWITCC